MLAFACVPPVLVFSTSRREGQPKASGFAWRELLEASVTLAVILASFWFILNVAYPQ
jgi:hypothetical protein